MSRDDLLAEQPFSYRAASSGIVMISYHGKTVTTLKGRDSTRFLSRMEVASQDEAQLMMARATGHFKHGTERVKKKGALD